MSTLLLLISIISNPQDTNAAQIIDNELYPPNRTIIILLEEETRRIKGLERIRKMRAEMPACPIQTNYWRDFDCA